MFLHLLFSFQIRGGHRGNGMNGAMRTVGGASDRGDFDPSDALLDAAPVDAPVGDSSLRPQLVVHQSLPLLVVQQ